MPRYAVVLPAAGKSRRFQDQHYKKPFASLDGRPVWLHSAEKFASRSDVCQTILVVSPDDRDEFDSKFGGNAALLGVEVVNGGAERSESVANALTRLKAEAEFVAIHDAARPCIATEWIDAVFLAAAKSGAAILAVPIWGTVKRVGPDHTIQDTMPRDGLWEAQTPQVFRKQLLLDAYARLGTEPVTDDAQLVERSGQRVTIVTGSRLNLKITTQEDLRIAAAMLKALPRPKLANSAHPFADDQLWR